MGAVTDLTTAKLNLKHMKEHTQVKNHTNACSVEIHSFHQGA